MAVATSQLRPAPDVDVPILLAENKRLKQALADERADNERLRAELRFVEELRALSNQTVSGSQKLVMLALYKKMAGRGDEWVEIPAWELAEDTGLSKAAVYDALNHCAEKLQVISKRTINDWSSGELRTPTQVSLKPRFRYPCLYPQNITRNHGGDRPKCKHCGSENIDRYKVTYCRDCKQWSHETIAEAPFNPDTLNPPVVRSSQIDHSGKEPSSGQVAQPLSSSIDSQLAHSGEGVNPITAPPMSLDSTATLTAWLEKRIGERIICATGKLEKDRKYFYQPEGYLPDIAAHLRGDPEHIYGSRLPQADGSTWLVCYDFDGGEHDARHGEYMTRLAQVGIASLYFKRRPGRGHLEIHFTRPVDALAAHQWIVSIVPELAECECFPIVGNQALSWPLWQRIGDVVTECEVEAMSPAEPGRVFACKGVKSDPGRLAELVRRCVTKRVLVPARKREETRPYAGGLLEKPLPRSAWEGDLIEAFNRSHTWDEIADMCGGYARTGM